MLKFVTGSLFFPTLFLICLYERTRIGEVRKNLFWGPVPIISNKYWAKALRGAGYISKTFVQEYYESINQKHDFDQYLVDCMPRKLRSRLWVRGLGYYFAFIQSIHSFGVFHIPFSGGFLGPTAIWFVEPYLIRLAGRKTIVIPYGADFYAYSRVMDPSLRHALLLSYPEASKKERRLKAQVESWTKMADIVVGGFMFDGLGRWDVLTTNPFVIDIQEWKEKESYSDADGMNNEVKIVHTPNHRGFKGTEFLMAAVDTLREEGLKIKLILVENQQNDSVKTLMSNADILVEQVIYTGYAFSGIEGMCSGLPVLANLENDQYTTVLRRYSFLDECPVLSTSPENLVSNLRALVSNPDLRKNLGQAGVKYVKKYHSYATAVALFSTIYEKIWDETNHDLLNYFHPLKSTVFPASKKLTKPLSEKNRLPKQFLI